MATERPPAGDGATLEARYHALDERYKRRGESLEFLHLITTTLANLSLHDAPAIGDSLLSLVSTFLGVEQGWVLSRGVGAEIGPLALRGAEAQAALDAPDSGALWGELLGERDAHALTGDAVAARWPDAPPAIRAHGCAAAAIVVDERAVAHIVLGARGTATPYQPEEIEFLACAAGIAAMAFQSAESYAAQRELMDTIERQAAAAQREAQRLIERQRLAIQQLSTPILELWDSVIALPVIGVVDSRRSAVIMETLLSEIVARQSRYVILDITGVEVVDTRTADHFIKVVKSAELLGARCIVTGIRPAVAQTLVELGVDLSSVATLRNLRAGLRECLRDMQRQRSPGARGEGP